jgi:hypothetical protein
MRQLGLSRRLDLEDEIGAEGGGCIDDLRAHRAESLVRKAGASPGAALDRDPVALRYVFLDRLGGGGNACFMRSRLGWHSDVHR